MNNGIELRVSNRLYKTLDLSGESVYTTGTTTIEAESSRNGKDISLYIQNKGFGFSSSKCVRAKLDNETAEELMKFLQAHLELSAQVDAMLKVIS